MTNYGMPFFLEDQSGEITGSEFVDIYNRMHLSLRCTLRDEARSAYMVYDLSSRRGSFDAPLACMDFGANNALGTIKVGSGDNINMSDYLSKEGSKSRKFTALDGQEYRWTYKRNSEEQWTCVNSSGYHVASYSLKPAGEPQYIGSSGCVLTVEEEYPHLAGELLASLIIMRHIAKHNL